MSAAAVAVVLMLQPVLAEDGLLRVAATGVADEQVVWLLDGVEVARTHDREAASVPVAAGAHELTASSLARGAWQAMARPDGAAAGAAFVPAWTAEHRPADPEPDAGATPAGVPWLPVTLGLLAAVLLAWPQRRTPASGRRAQRVRP